MTRATFGSLFLCILASGCDRHVKMPDQAAFDAVPIETRVFEVEEGLVSLVPKPRCDPPYSLVDEDEIIQKLSESVRLRYMVDKCPVIGCGQVGSAKAQSNTLKNRATPPTVAELDLSLTLANLMGASTDDRQSWSEGKAVRITGYVRDVKGTGAESVNCRVESKAFSDTHIDLMLEATDDSNDPQMFVVEVTPRMRAIAAANGEDWSSPTLRQKLLGRWVEFTGWLFFDDDHCNEALNTQNVSTGQCGGNRNNPWRQTAWEVHPVTQFRVLSGRPRQ